MIRKLKLLIKMALIYLSPTYAMKTSNKYWQNTTKTHGSMDEEQFDFYYSKLKELINPKLTDKILDYGGGNGEIAYRFKKEEYNIYHCDMSKIMVKNAMEKFSLDSCECKDIEGKYDIILMNNAYLCVHPKLAEDLLRKFYLLLNENGKVYITDIPDFEKRYLLSKNLLYLIVTYFIPVYDPEFAGFFVKDSDIRKLAKRTGFAVKDKLDSWCNYRSHWILEKLK
jgi:cyclopropane fatty-acyl-phospholipid synthase-like methyltransferase